MKKSRKIAAIGLAAVLVCGSTFSALADEVTTQDVDEVTATIDSLAAEKAALLSEIDSLDEQLVVTIASIDALDVQIPEKDDEIKETEKSYKTAVDVQNVEYEAMKKRIQYLYENGGDAGWATLLLEDSDITEFLNMAEYTQQMYQYDRDCLEHYANIVKNVKNIQTKLEGEQAELVTMRSEQELQKQYLEQLLDEKRASCDDFDEQIAGLEATAQRYREIIEEQNRAMQELARQQYEASMAAAAVDTSAMEEAQAQASDAAAQAEAAAQAQAEAEAAAAAAQAAAEAAAQGSDPEAEAAAAQAAAEAAAAQAQAEAEAAAAAQAQAEAEAAAEAARAAAEAEAAAQAQAEAEAQQQQEQEQQQEEPAPAPSSGLGQEVVNWALQWVGVTPYVWAGNSLTAGTDCSGFVHLVYANFGIYVPRGSYDCRFCGYEVSYAEAQPGDIICYDGHVALYIGGGAIVHASDEATGTKISYDATYRPILTVRRVI